MSEMLANVREAITDVGIFFYIINPQETSYKEVSQMPDFVNKAVPYFIGFIFLEYILLWWRRKPQMHLNDSITSMANGLLLECGKIIFRGIESMAYFYIYENYRLFELPWDSVWTWYIAALGVDLGYYWIHRAGHEVNIFWAQHQVHHSSEHYNLTTALRQAVFQGWFAWIFYLPLALCVPPAQFLTHQQFNLLFQFWIHTEIIDSLGPLEWIFNTPKHHRIHHGSNRYCLDKNYAGVLIIWDRMFGTFAEEKEGEKIVYGLVENVPSFNPLWLQSFYYGKMWEKMSAMTTYKDKLSVLFKGPGWMPGTGRLGDINQVPEVQDRKKYSVRLPLWQNVYLFFHYSVLILGYQELAVRSMSMNQLTVLGFVLYIIISLTSIGLLFDNNPLGCIIEVVRSFLFVWYVNSRHLLTHSYLLMGLYAYFCASGMVWSVLTINLLNGKKKVE